MHDFGFREWALSEQHASGILNCSRCFSFTRAKVYSVFVIQRLILTARNRFHKESRGVPRIKRKLSPSRTKYVNEASQERIE